MDKIITDNSKVNENLLNKVNTVDKQNKELIVKNMELQEQLLIQRVSNRRELLIAWEKFKDESHYNRFEVVIESDMDDFLSN